MGGEREIGDASGGAEDTDINELAVDLDSRTLHLLTAVKHALSEHQWLHGSMRATQIGDGVRREMGIPATELAGPEATEYLERVIRALESDAARSAKHGWARYRTLWYLRRLPYELFSFGDELATTAPYDLRLTEVLMTRGGDPNAIPQRLDVTGSFPIDDSVARRLAREIGFAKAVSQYQRLYRRCAKGAVLRLERRGRSPMSSVMPNAVESTELSSAIRLYDERSAKDRYASGALALHGLGTPALEELPPMRTGSIEKKLALVGDLPDAPVPLEIEGEHEGRPAKMVIPAYRMATVADLETLAELLTDPRVSEPGLWHEEMALLIAVLNLGPLIFQFTPRNRYNLFKQGYMILSGTDIERLWDEFSEPIRSQMAGYLGNIVDPLPKSGREFLSRLLAVEGSSWPLVEGPVAFRVKEDQFGLDLLNATTRLGRRLEYPATAGEIANIRADAFERATQQVIDATQWRPTDRVASYRGRHLRLEGERIGEIDAIAERDGTALLVSCKSRVYTAAYDMGRHNVVRNTAEYISRAVVDWEAFVGKLRRNPAGDNYDLSVFEELRGVVVTPTVFYVAVDIAEKEALSGLRYYSSLGEFQKWMSEDETSG